MHGKHAHAILTSRYEFSLNSSVFSFSPDLVSLSNGVISLIGINKLYRTFLKLSRNALRTCFSSRFWFPAAVARQLKQSCRLETKFFIWFHGFSGGMYAQIVDGSYELIFDASLFQNLRQLTWKSVTRQKRATESRMPRHVETIWTNSQFVWPKNNFKQQKKTDLRKKFRQKMQRHWNATRTTPLISFPRVNQRIFEPLDSANCEIRCTTKEIALWGERLSVKLTVMTTNKQYGGHGEQTWASINLTCYKS